MTQRLALVDGSSYLFRAYHALPPLTRRSDALPVGAVAGFCNMLRKLIDDRGAIGDVTHFAVIFDASGGSFRDEIYPEYKAHRPDPPEDLRPQFPLVREATRAFSLPAIELTNYEADDIIATYAEQAAQAGFDVVIVASDKDMMQLVRPGVSMFDTMKDRRIGRDEVIEKFGVPPEKVIDIQALAGDSVDNVPGVPGIGIKTAALLINEMEDLDSLLARAEEIPQQKRRENLIEFAEQARVSRELVTLKRDVPGLPPLASLELQPRDPEKLIAFLKAMEFTTITKRIGEEAGIDPGEIAAAEGFAALGEAPTDEGKPAEEGESFTLAAMAEREAQRVRNLPLDTSAYACLTSLDEVKAWISEAYEQSAIGFDTETNSLDATQAELVGISLALAPGKACYIPLGHRQEQELFADPQSAQLAERDVLALLKPLLEDEGVLKVAHNVKFDNLVFLQRGIKAGPLDDTMLLSYVSDAGNHGQGLDELSKRWLGHEPISFKELTKDQKGVKDFSLVPIDQAAPYAAEDADLTLRLWMVLKPRVAASGLMSVYERLERPLVPVLVDMENAGILVDRAMLARLSQELADGMALAESEALALTSKPFNLASPKQLGDILFGELGLPGGKKTKTGAWSTDASALEKLAVDGHELPRKVLTWRTLAKLKSTYADALPGSISAKTGRVHTSYSMASTSTGRLSSSDPNLQNIPVRTAEGRRIRQAFVPPPGRQLISADYSQIELRVLAHVADIDALKTAFAEGLDIHAMTASEMFGVPIEGMDPMVRRQAKAINFGIIYGISPFGLAAQLSISRTEAKTYMDRYFERFPGILSYMERMKAEVAEKGYVETIFGRRAHYPGAKSKNPAERAFVERAAINAPIQGSAADIIRLAMVKMEAALRPAAPSAVMLLQVHDELIFEVDDAEVDAAIATARQVMQKAPEPMLQLSVPLIVDARAARNWDEAH